MIGNTLATVWGLATPDIVTIVVYFSVIIYVGYRAMKRVRNQEDYFMAGRRFGKAIQTFAAFGQATSAENATATTSMVAQNGAAGVWANLAGGLANMPIFWMCMVWYRRMRLLTLADFFQERYGSRTMPWFYSVCQAIFMVVQAAVGLTAISKTVAIIEAKPVVELNQVEHAEYDRAIRLEKLAGRDFDLLTPADQATLIELQKQNPRKEFSYLNENWVIVITAVVTLLYTVAGGLEAAFVTDLIQGSFILVLTLLLVPFAIAKLNQVYGGSSAMDALRSMHRVLPDSFFSIWGSPRVPEFTWYWIVAFTVLTVLNVAVQANQLTASGSARDEYVARFGFVSGLFLKRYSVILWGFLAMMTLVLYGRTVRDPDYVWGVATRDLLGPPGIGLVGLMIACLMAALMACKSALMLTTSALLTRNVYLPIVPRRPDHHYVWAGRAFCVLYMIASAWVAIEFKSVFGLFKFLVMFNSILAASFWLGMLWRRANRAGAWASMILTFVLTVLFPFGLPLIPGIRSNAYLLKMTDPIHVTRGYHASQADVDDRNKLIEQWDRAAAHAPAAPTTVIPSPGDRPRPLHVDERFTRTDVMPAKSVFWNDGIKDIDGRRSGDGFLKVDLLLFDRLGWDLSKNSYSLNETLAMIERIILPIAVLIVVSKLTRPDDKDRLDQFYGKMRTKVVADHDEDAREMERTRANPRRFDHLKLFPGSDWEFRKWDGQDWKGVIVTTLGAAGLVALMVFLVKLGS